MVIFVMSINLSLFQNFIFEREYNPVPSFDLNVCPTYNDGVVIVSAVLAKSNTSFPSFIYVKVFNPVEPIELSGSKDGNGI